MADGDATVLGHSFNDFDKFLAPFLAQFRKPNACG